MGQRQCTPKIRWRAKSTLTVPMMSAPMPRRHLSKLSAPIMLSHNIAVQTKNLKKKRLDSSVETPRLNSIGSSFGDQDIGSIGSCSSLISTDSCGSPCPARHRPGDFKALKLDWQLMDNRQLIFLNIFSDIVLNSDEDMFKKLPKRFEGGEDVTMIHHAANVQKFFEEVMIKDDLDDVWGMGRALGRRHSKFGITFHAAYWLCIKRNFIKYLSPDDTAQLHMLWMKFMHDLIRQVRLGFNEAILDNFSIKSFSAE